MTSSEPGRQSWQGSVLRDLAPEPASANGQPVVTGPTIDPDDSTATQVVDPAALGVTAPIPTAADLPAFPAAEATTMLPPGGLPPLTPGIPAQNGSPAVEAVPAAEPGPASTAFPPLFPAPRSDASGFPQPSVPPPAAAPAFPAAAPQAPDSPAVPAPDVRATGFQPPVPGAPTSGVPASGFPAPAAPAPGFPAPGYEAPGFPAAGFPAPGAQVPGAQVPGGSGHGAPHYGAPHYGAPSLGAQVAAAQAAGLPVPGAALPPGQHPGEPSRVFGPDATPVPQQWTPAGLLPMPEHADSRMQRLRSSVRGVGGSGRAAREAADIAHELGAPVATGRRVAVLGIRGGSGKSTVAALLVSAYATHRGDRVLAVDADPDLGSLGLRLGANSPTSLANLGRVPRVWSTLDEAERCLGRSQSGAWILSGERHSAAPETVPPNAYLGVLHGISRYFAVTVVDAGAGMVTPLNQAVLADAHAIVLATPASIDGVVSARRALEWIREWNPQRLQQCVIALTAMSPQAADIDLARTAEAFGPFGVAPALLPYDRHLATGSTIEPWRLGERTRNAAVQLAASALGKARVVP